MWQLVWDDRLKGRVTEGEKIEPCLQYYHGNFIGSVLDDTGGMVTGTQELLTG